MQYENLERKLEVYLPGIEKTLRIVLAVAIASHFQFPAMLWLLLVDVPSSGKTDLVRLIKDSEISYYLDNLTQNAFISGERVTKTNKVHDLLPLLDKKCFIVKDWTSIFSLDEKMTKKILGDMVNIYDKEFAKFSSARGIIKYESYFSHLGCITPATLNKHTQYLNMIGARFLFHKLPEISKEDEEAGRKRLFGVNNRSEIENSLREQISSYLNFLTKKEWNIKPLDENIQKYLWVGASLISHCRGIIMLQVNTFKNESAEEVKYYSVSECQIEKPWRAGHQLRILAECLAFVVEKETVGIEELEVIKEIVMASMPADRSQALRILQKHNGVITAKELSDDYEKSQRTSRRLLDELVGLKVLQKISGSGSMPNDYKISDEFKDFICLSPGEFLSSYSLRTETTQDSPLIAENEEAKTTNNNNDETNNYWEQYIVKKPVGDLDNDNILALLNFSRDYSHIDEIPEEYRAKFKLQAIELESECKKRGIL